jgi:hypothetical protein
MKAIEFIYYVAACGICTISIRNFHKITEKILKKCLNPI